MTETAIALLKSAELMVFCLAAASLFRRRAYTIAESVSYAIFTVFIATLSVIQFSLRMGSTPILPIAETSALLFSIGILYHHHKTAAALAKPSLALLKHHPFLISLFFLFMIFLGICSVLKNSGMGADAPFFRFPLWYAGGDALDLLKRFYTTSRYPRGPAFFSYLAYLSIGFSTYALARRHAWSETAIVVTMIVLSLPRFVLLATIPDTELISCSMALFSILCLYRTIEKPTIENLFFLIAAITVGLSGRLYIVCFSSILVLLCSLSLYRRHGGAIWIGLIKSNRRSLFILILGLFLTTFALMPVDGLVTSTGLPDILPELYNKDGIQGTGANLLRYLLVCLNPGQPVEKLFDLLSGPPLPSILEDIYRQHVMPLTGNLGLAEPFRIAPSPDPVSGWFGPFGILLILPGIVFAFLRGSRRLKGIGLSLAGYCFVISLVFAWTPANAKYFSLFFACGGFTAAHFLPPWRLTEKGRILFIAACLVLMIYTGLSGIKPL